ncbi:hypothetical protein ElyMa_001148000 [Elysia marginata]|uniref:Uncharacterized protein n=1 Tax=Elysia marginata TaxID=1093978 RepID=A0AAV4I1K3_9GAST|nr:hypothetical protein ElyMa_001148000 [Elysia marginata]
MMMMMMMMIEDDDENDDENNNDDEDDDDDDDDDDDNDFEDDLNGRPAGSRACVQFAMHDPASVSDRVQPTWLVCSVQSAHHSVSRRCEPQPVSLGCSIRFGESIVLI